MTYTYDARGQMVSSTNAAGDTFVTQTFDASGLRLTRVTAEVVRLKTRLALALHETRYLYDADGKLIARIQRQALLPSVAIRCSLGAAVGNPTLQPG